MGTKRIKGITIEIDGNTTKLTKALDSSNKTLSKTQTALKDVNKLLKLDPTNTNLLKQKQDLLKTSIVETKKKLDQEKDALKQLKSADQTDKVKEQQQLLEREIADTEQSLKSLKEEYKRFGAVASQQIDAVGGKITAAGEGIRDVGEKLSKVSAASAAVLAGIAKAGIDFESAWTGVTKTVDGTDEQMKKIKQGILDLATETASSSAGIAAVAEAAGQLGVKANDILDFTETMVRLGDSTNIAAEDAAVAIAQLFNITGESLNNVDNFGATIVELGNNLATSESKIMDMATRVGAAGTQIGLNSREILALSGALSSVGLEVEAGGSAISTILTRVDKAVATNAGSLEDWAAVAGMSVKDFKNFWETDTMSAVQALISGLGNAKAGGQNLNVMLEELNIKSIRQTDTMKRLAGASDLLADSVKLANSAWDENSALTNESEKRYQTTEAQLSQLKEMLKNVSIMLSAQLLPVINKIVDFVKTVLEKLQQLSPTAQKNILIVLAVIAAIGPLLTIIGTVIVFIGNITTAIGALSAANLALDASLLPIIAIIAAVVAVIAIVIVVVKHWGEICEWFKKVWQKIVDAIKKKLDEAKNKFFDFKDKITNFFYTIKGLVDSAKNWGKDLIDNFVNSIKKRIYKVKDIASTVAGTVKDFLGFSEPKKGPLSNFHTFMPDMIDLMNETILQSIGNLNPSLERLAATLLIEPDINATQTMAITNSNNDAVNALSGKLDKLITLMQQQANKQIYLDSGELVGGLANGINRKLGEGMI